MTTVPYTFAERPSQRIVHAFEKDVQRSQLRLPFPDEKTIDVPRCCSILHVSENVVYRLVVTPSKPGSDEMMIAAYRTMPRAPLRIDYDSLISFIDSLRVKHGIIDRRPPPVFGRYRDDDLLPFPWSDTMTVEEAADALTLSRQNLMLRVESGVFEAYQLVRNSPWRVSRTSFSKYLSNVSHIPLRGKPYGG